MIIHVPYGGEELSASLDWAQVCGTLSVPPAPSVSVPAELVARSLENPIGQDGPLSRRIKPGQSILIIVSDQFRQTRVDEVLPVLLQHLAQAGVREHDVRLLFATGTHRPPTPEEQARVLGAPLFERFSGRIHVHNAFDPAALTPLGVTSRGTPVHVNRLAVEADHVIATGAVVFHYFGGFGGGRKSIVPGIAGAETIARNHAMNLHATQDSLDPCVRIGVLDGNPVAEDMLEAARFLKVDAIVNTVLDSAGRIAAAFAGEMDAAHRVAAQFAHSMFAVPIEQRADLVIASSGAARNFVQSHKALYNAWQAMKPGGRIVFLARCDEGLGGDQFVKWLRLGTRQAVIAGLRQQSEINGQTALSSLEKAPSALFVTSMSEMDTRLLGATKACSLEEALVQARTELKGVASPTCLLMPHASYTVPFPSF